MHASARKSKAVTRRRAGLPKKNRRNALTKISPPCHCEESAARRDDEAIPSPITTLLWLCGRRGAPSRPLTKADVAGMGNVSATMRRTLASGAIVLLLSCLPKAAVAGCTCGCGIESCNPGSCSWKTCSAANCGATCPGGGTCSWCTVKGGTKCLGVTKRCGDAGSGGCGQGNACYPNCPTKYCANRTVPACSQHEGTCGCGCRGWGCIAPGETCDCGYDEDNPPPNCSTAGGNRCGGLGCACGLVCSDGLSGNPCGGKGCGFGGSGCGGGGCTFPTTPCNTRCKKATAACTGKGCRVTCGFLVCTTLYNWCQDSCNAALVGGQCNGIRGCGCDVGLSQSCLAGCAFDGCCSSYYGFCYYNCHCACWVGFGMCRFNVPPGTCWFCWQSMQQCWPSTCINN